MPTLSTEIIEEFFDAIDDIEIDTIKVYLSQYPDILTKSFESELPFETSKKVNIIFKNSFEQYGGIYSKKDLDASTEVKNLIIDATVLYAINNEDTNLMQYMYDKNAAPYLTLSNGINPREYAQEHGKIKAVAWIKETLRKGSERFKALGDNPFAIFAQSLNNLSQLAEEKQALEAQHVDAKIQIVNDSL